MWGVTHREAGLLARAQAGDAVAFDELVRAHSGRLMAIALRLVRDRGEAEDVVQETLLRAWLGIGRFRAGSTVFTWLYRIAVNESMRALERRARHVDVAPRLRRACFDDEPALHAESRELRASIGDAVRALPRVYRTALVLRDIEGLSTREAAGVAGVAEAVLKRRLHIARLIVRGALERA